jgi:hypothetical protein
VFENRVLRRIFGQREMKPDCWRKLYIDELPNLYSFPNVIRRIKSSTMRCSGHVALRERRGMCVGYWWESQKKRDY